MPDGAIGRSGVGGRCVLHSAGAKEGKCEEIKSDKKHGKEWVCPILSYLFFARHTLAEAPTRVSGRVRT